MRDVWVEMCQCIITDQNELSESQAKCMRIGKPGNVFAKYSKVKDIVCLINFYWVIIIYILIICERNFPDKFFRVIHKMLLLFLNIFVNNM